MPALALELDHVPGVELFQVVQTGPATLRVRLRLVPDAEAEGVWAEVLGRLRGVLAGLGLEGVEVERAVEPPEPSPAGKTRPVIPLTVEGGPP